MVGHVQVESPRAEVIAIDVLRRRQLLMLAGAALCLLSSWYFARVIAPDALGISTPNLQQGLFPEWLGGREILHGRDPYRREVTQQIELELYGGTIPEGSSGNQNRFAYPVFFIFLFFPLAVLPFQVAQLVMLFLCVALSAMSVFLWLQGTRFGNLDRVSFTILAFASYPLVLALQLRQPTLIIAALLALAVFWVRSGRLVAAGIVAALSASKPHLAIAILLPLSIWAIASWRIRKAFLLSLGASLFALLLVSEIAVGGWFTQWLTTMRAYSHYAGATPLLADFLHGHFVLPAAVLLLAAIVWVSFEFHASDLLFAISFSVAAFQLLFPFQIYNEVLLLPAALWTAMNATNIRERGQLHVLLFGCAWTALASGWVATVGLALWDIAAPGSGLKLWQLPLVAAWLYPMLLFAALATFAASSLLLRRPSRIEEQMAA